MQPNCVSFNQRGKKMRDLILARIRELTNEQRQFEALWRRGNAQIEISEDIGALSDSVLLTLLENLLALKIGRESQSTAAA
jgi:hypothetical protein